MPKTIFDRTDKKRVRVDPESLAILEGGGTERYSYDRRGSTATPNPRSVGKVIKINGRRQTVTEDYTVDSPAARIIRYEDNKGRDRHITKKKNSTGWFGDMPGKGALRVDLSALGE